MTHRRVGLMLPYWCADFLESVATPPDLLALLPQEFVGPSAFLPVSVIDDLSQDFDLHLHSTGLSVATASGVNVNWLARLRDLASSFRIDSVSDHLGYARIDQLWTGTPLVNPPFNTDSLEATLAAVETIGRALPCDFYLENNSFCIDWPTSTLTEPEFWATLLQSSTVSMLLDLPNLLGRCRVTQTDPFAALDALPLDRVRQVHIAGGDWLDDYHAGRVARAHSHAVEDLVWQMLERCVERNDELDVVLERTVNFDSGQVEEELERVRGLLRSPRAADLESGMPGATGSAPHLPNSEWHRQELLNDEEFVLELCLDISALEAFAADPIHTVARRIPPVSPQLERLEVDQVRFQAGLIRLYNVNELVRSYPEVAALWGSSFRERAEDWYASNSRQINGTGIDRAVDFGTKVQSALDEAMISEPLRGIVAGALAFRLQSLRSEQTHRRLLQQRAAPLFDQRTGVNLTLEVLETALDLEALVRGEAETLSENEFFAFFFPPASIDQETLQLTKDEALWLAARGAGSRNLSTEAERELREAGILS